MFLLLLISSYFAEAQKTDTLTFIFNRGEKSLYNKTNGSDKSIENENLQNQNIF
jgi:hypothetical protein